MVTKKELALKLFDVGCIKFGSFTFKSGIVSPQYVDLRILVSFPEIMRLAAEAYVEVLKPLHFDRMAGVPYAALPFVGAVSMLNGKPWIYTRKEIKGYGTNKPVEGLFTAGETVVVLDDVVSFGDSKLEAVKHFTDAGLLVKDIVVLIDRCMGAEKVLSENGLALYSFMRLDEMLDIYLAEGKLTSEKVDEVKDFLANAKHP